VLAEALGTTVRRLRRRGRAALTTTDPQVRDAGLHEVRKAAKRVRYTAEVAAPVLGEDATALVGAMTEVQDVLGARQDTLITRALCRQLGVEAFAAGENAWTYGRLHALEEARATATEEEFRTLWAALRPQLKAVATTR
jgi:CHAD domain-containing protein